MGRSSYAGLHWTWQRAQTTLALPIGLIEISTNHPVDLITTGQSKQLWRNVYAGRFVNIGDWWTMHDHYIRVALLSVYWS